MPNTSPSHHENQFGAIAARGRVPNRCSEVTPTVAAIRHASGPPTANSRNTSRSFLSRSGNPNHRSMSACPASACSVEPIAIRTQGRILPAE